MSTQPSPSDDAAKTFNAYDPSNSIRFEEKRKLPMGMIAAVVGGFLVLCAVAFTVLYKVNVAPPAKAPPPRDSQLGTPPPPQARIDGSLPPVANKPQTSASSGIPGAIIDEDGNTVITKAESQCTFLRVHLKNLDEMVGENPDAVQWVTDKRNQAKGRMALLGC
jgi:hypothetical protein